jgi:cobalt-zinc-cadmium efflux system membrane fusion protein
MAGVIGFGIALCGFVPQVLHPIKTAILGAEVGSEELVPSGLPPKSSGSAPAHTENLIRRGTPKSSVVMSPDQVQAAAIEVVAAGPGDLSRKIVVPGTISPSSDRVARIPARVAGTVVRLGKRLGDFVTEGEIVAVLGSREVADAKSEYLTASVDFELHKTTFERTESLWSRQVATEQSYLGARAGFRQAQLRVDLARQKLSALGIDANEIAEAARRDAASPGALDLRRYDIRSPIRGQVIDRKVDPGSAVGREGDPSELYTIADLSVVWVELAVPTADLEEIRTGQRVQIHGTGKNRNGEGRIVFIGPLLNQETHSARVIAEVENGDLGWRAGSFVTAEIVTDEHLARLRVPRAALQTIDGRSVAFVRTATGFDSRQVETGKSDEEAVEVVAGVSPGERIAVTNTFLLKAELGKAEAAQAN